MDLIKAIINYHLVKEIENNILALSKILEKVAKIVEKKDTGMIARYKGQEVYACDKDEYFAHKEEYDRLGKVWLLNEQNLLVYRGKVLGIVCNDDSIETLPRVDVVNYFPEEKEKLRKLNMERLKEQLKND